MAIFVHTKQCVARGIIERYMSLLGFYCLQKNGWGCLRKETCIPTKIVKTHRKHATNTQVYTIKNHTQTDAPKNGE